MKTNFFLIATLLPFLIATTAFADTTAEAPAIHFENRAELELFLRQSLEAIPETTGDARPPVPAELTRVITENQQQAGDWLLQVAIDAQNPLNRRAVGVFVESIRLMSAEQITAYVKGAMQFEVRLRPRYPEGFDVTASYEYFVRHKWFGWPSRIGKLQVQVSHFVDGQSHIDKFNYEGPMATTGHMETQSLALGTHTASMKMHFAWEMGDLHGEGDVDSLPFSFEIVDGTLPDDLETVDTPEARKLIAQTFAVKDIDLENDASLQPQQTSTRNGKTYGARLPTVYLSDSLPFALAFSVEIHDLKSGRVFKGNQVLIPADKAYGDYYFGLDNVHSFADQAVEQFVVGRELMPGQQKIIPVKIVLQPSYQMALHYPEISAFFGGSLTFDNLHIAITQPEN